MSSQFTQFSVSEPNARPSTPTAASVGKGKGGSTTKRNRKARGASTTASPAIHAGDLGAGVSAAGAQSAVQWATPAPPERGGTPITLAPNTISIPEHIANIEGRRGTPSGSRAGSVLHAASLGEAGPSRIGAPIAEDDGEGEDDLLPEMADDDYSAQLSWQSQSKDNLKVLMDNFTPEQYDRYEAYRRNALPKQAVRKVVQQTLGQQVSAPVAQIVAGFAKVFVGEVIEKARKVQQRRGESGPLSPDHLREAYREYQEETGRVGAARPTKGKKLFVR